MVAMNELPAPSLLAATAATAAVTPARPRIGVALGSGSARGWSHIGVLHALDEAGLSPDIICGTSIGAFVGAAAASGELTKLEHWVRSLTWKGVLGFFDVSLTGGLLKGEKIIQFFSEHFIDRDIHTLPVSFACVATDLANGREIWFRDGSVADAVRASMALPGLFAPKYLHGRWLVDGGLVNPVPVSLCRALGADIVVAVDLGADRVGPQYRNVMSQRTSRAPGGSLGQRLTSAVRQWMGRDGSGDDSGAGGNPADPNDPVPSRSVLPPQPPMLDVVSLSINIMQSRIASSRLAGEPADLVVAPRLHNLGLMDYHRGAEAIDTGRDAMHRLLPMLRETIESYV